jgi:hypothetical protein
MPVRAERVLVDDADFYLETISGQRRTEFS